MADLCASLDGLRQQYPEIADLLQPVIQEIDDALSGDPGPGEFPEVPWHEPSDFLGGTDPVNDDPIGRDPVDDEGPPGEEPKRIDRHFNIQKEPCERHGPAQTLDPRVFVDLPPGVEPAPISKHSFVPANVVVVGKTKSVIKSGLGGNLGVGKVALTSLHRKNEADGGLRESLGEAQKRYDENRGTATKENIDAQVAEWQADGVYPAWDNLSSDEKDEWKNMSGTNAVDGDGQRLYEKHVRSSAKFAIDAERINDVANFQQAILDEEGLGFRTAEEMCDLGGGDCEDVQDELFNAFNICGEIEAGKQVLMIQDGCGDYWIITECCE